MSFPTEAERLARLHKRAGCDCAEDEAMPIDLDEVRKKHERYRHEAIRRDCRNCDEPYPCDAIQLVNEAERQSGLFAVARKESEGLARLIVERDAELKLSASAINKQIEVNQGLRDELAQAWGLTDADTEAARTAEIKRLREAGTKICEGFDKGIFIRSTSGDGESAWAIKPFPYLQALAVFADEKEEGE